MHTFHIHIYRNNMTVHIVSYNLLVPIYAEEPGYYIKSRPEFLTTGYRWRLIQSQLQREIRLHENTIICLQELSNTMLSKLNKLFRQMNYKFYHSLYGNRYNDYMGVGIAVPVSMQLISTNFISVGDRLRSTMEPHEKQCGLIA